VYIILIALLLFNNSNYNFDINNVPIYNITVNEMVICLPYLWYNLISDVK